MLCRYYLEVPNGRIPENQEATGTELGRYMENFGLKNCIAHWNLTSNEYSSVLTSELGLFSLHTGRPLKSGEIEMLKKAYHVFSEA